MATDSPSSNLGPWIISGLALLQVWAIALWRYLRRPQVDIYETGNIELGYSRFGHTLGLTGTLHVKHKEVFVRSLTARIPKRKDGSIHTFRWRAFRGNELFPSSDRGQKLELASSFLLTPTNPYTYNIFFVDETFLADVSPKVDGLLAKWHKYRANAIEVIEEDIKENAKSLVQSQAFDERLFQEFSRTGELLPFYTLLDRAFYLSPGKYKIEVRVETPHHLSGFERAFEFDLSEADVEILRSNSLHILRSICGLEAHFSFANPRYSETGEPLRAATGG